MGAGTDAVDGGLAEPHGTSLPCAPMSTELRPAEAGDVTLLLDLVRRLAEAQDAGGYVESTAEDLLRDGFGTAPRFHAVLAEQVDDATGARTAVGLALYHFTYSTWAGRPNLYVEDRSAEH